jgi:uncharacterized protein (TIGR03067 family)
MRKRVLLAAAMLPLAHVTLAADADSELSKLEGTWKAVSYTQNGKEMKGKEVTELKLTIKGNEYTWLYNGGRTREKGTLKVDAAKKPKRLILTNNIDKSFRTWIYERTDDKLKVCYSFSPNLPKEFASKAGSRDHLIVWKKE